MREIITSTTAALTPPPEAERAEAAKGGTRDRHDAWMAGWSCLHEIELAPVPAPLPAPAEITVAAWNIERCKCVEDSAALIRAAGADVVLATEMDWGMARSGQRHATRDLAVALGMGYAFGVEFVELGTGDAYETSLFAGTPNAAGLHGNAILSRLPLRHVAVIPIAPEGHWFGQSPKGDAQYRVGGRMAITAQIDLAGGPLALTAVHYESESDAAGRDAQTARMLAGLAAHHGDMPGVIGGDLNTADLGGMARAQVLCRPDAAEPGFARLRAAGFDWTACNTGAPTTRAAPGRPVRYPLRRLDWLFARGADTHAPAVLPALSETGDYLSDHEMIITKVHL